MNRHGVLLAVVAFCLLTLASPRANAAEEIKWHRDYQKARQEATERGKPLLIDFGTQNCYWCKQLDVRTFSDPHIITLITDHCVALKIDANENRALTDALRINSFPTLVFAGSDGRILGFQEGFVEAQRLKELLQRTIAGVATPEWMTRDFKEAGRAVAASDFARAVTLLKNIVEDGKDRPVQGKARNLLAEIEQQASSRLARARQFVEASQANEADTALQELGKAYAGTAAAREGNQLLMALAARSASRETDRAGKAKELLAQARADYRAQQFSICLDRCEAIGQTFSDLPEALQATQLAAEIKGNPEWLKMACDQLGDRLSVLYLALAESWLQKGQPQLAIFYFERVVQQFPNSKQAETAHVRLAQVQGIPTRQVDLKR